MVTRLENLSGKLRKLSLWLMLLVIGFMCTTVRSEAAGISKVKVQGNFLYSQSSAMAQYVNNARTAAQKKTVKLDPNLTAAAMQRAAELSVDFSHTRPNGKSCLTVTKYAADKGCSENITMGRIPSNGGAIANIAFGSFQRSKNHNANMLNNNHTAVGIGIFTTNGYYYCVQIFSNTSKASGPLPVDVKQTKQVEVLDGRYKFVLTCDQIKTDTKPGTGYKLKVSNRNPGFNNSLISRFHASCFIWKSSAPNVVTVDASGNVKLRKAGTATITATLKTGKQKVEAARITVYGTPANGPVTRVSISKQALTLNKGGKATLTATALPENAANRKITWKSGNSSVVKVDSKGQVTAVGRGSTVIMAVANNGTCATCNVTVK
ncbi:MAG: Ig-like domain-containing protein [Blautia sp.]|nr:Ig-like domain-containing protein [Blautia sp.]